MMWGYGFGWGPMFVMLLGTALFIALLAVLAWAMIAHLNGRTTSPPPVVPGPSALEILGQRYARGEIDGATYEQMRARLEQPPQH
ncbi:MAG TPA: SHOCT domain-containing protein [Ktedonobacteraceae bacterium]|nr:SHOCT domain-containing protein [Ktedonobacteraceae bacterium]